MVTGVTALHRRFAKVPNVIKAEVEKQIAKEADKLVAEMKLVVSEKSGDLRESIDWTWGDAPAGSLVIGRAFGKDYGKVSVTIYADKFYARHQEFGTIKMAANPFFFPIYRANKTRIRGNLTRAVTRAMKKV